METRIELKEPLNEGIPYFDLATKTFLFENLKDQTIYITYDHYFPSQMKMILKNSQLQIIETFVGAIKKAAYQIDLDATSTLHRLSVLVDLHDSMELTKNIYNEGRYTSMQIDLSEANIASVENVYLNRPDANTNVINGIYAFDHYKKNYQTNLNHEVSDTLSKAQIFAINHESAHVSVFTDAYIKRGASRSKTNQEGRIINLSNTCSGIVLPNLHIDENDVEASHSCSVGSVNKDHLYYLQSRGFSTIQAENILIKGYFNPLLRSIEDEEMRNSLSNLLTQRIG